jgi:hypothetical protein
MAMAGCGEFSDHGHLKTPTSDEVRSGHQRWIGTDDLRRTPFKVRNHDGVRDEMDPTNDRAQPEHGSLSARRRTTAARRSLSRAGARKSPNTTMDHLLSRARAHGR